MRYEMWIGAVGVLAATLATATPARAECDVRFVRAPEDVRIVIERWLRAETACIGTIELRVVPTDNGRYFLVAQRPDGRIHEREVPDAEAAGVLVASWVADAWTHEPRPTARSVNRASPEMLAVADAYAPRFRRSIMLAAGVGVGGALDDAGRSIRMEVDALGGKRWTLGVGLLYGETHHVYPGIYNVANDTRFSVHGSLPLHHGRWGLRLSVALGLNLAENHIRGGDLNVVGDLTTGGPSGASVGASVEAEALASYRIGNAWALTAGPTFAVVDRSFTAMDSFYLVAREYWVLAGARYEL